MYIILRWWQKNRFDIIDTYVLYCKKKADYSPDLYIIGERVMGMEKYYLRPQQLIPRRSVVLLIGPPLVGKDEMVKHLSSLMTKNEIRGTVRHISVNEVLRWSTNRCVQLCRNTDRPVPSEVLLEVMEKEINANMQSVHLTVINDYPRTREQAECLLALLQRYRILRPVCVHLAGNYELLSRRLTTHLLNKRNEMATFDEIMLRWEEYRHSCETLIPYLRQVTQFVEVNSAPLDERKQKPNSIFAEMWALIGHHITDLQPIST